MALKGVNILERDSNDKTLWAWSFPTVSQSQTECASRKYADLHEDQSFACFRHRDEWCYLYSTQLFESDILYPKVKHCAILVWSSEYNVEKYRTFSRILCKRYCKTGDPTVVLQLYLSVFTTGMCDTEENGSFFTRHFNMQAKKSDNLHLAELINLFGLEIILVYTALLLKKRLLVYDHNLSVVLQVVDTLSRMLPHRAMNNSIYPWVHVVSEEVMDLKGHNGYIAGSLDSSIASHTELYDILVNVAAREVVISPASREAFVMTKTHKDIAVFLVQLAGASDSDISTEISSKTDGLLAQLRLLATTVTAEGHKMITIEDLRSKQFPPPLENFLFNLAIAENIMML